MENHEFIIIVLCIVILGFAVSLIALLVERNGKTKELGDSVTAVEISENDCIVIDQKSIVLYRNVVQPFTTGAKKKKTERILFSSGSRKRLTEVN